MYPEHAAALITLATNQTGIDPTTWLIYNGGALGVILIMVASGILRTKAEVAGLNARIEGLEAQLEKKDRLIEMFQMQMTGQAIPALARSAQVIEHLPSNEAAMRDELRITRDRVADLAKQLSDTLNRELGT